MMSRLLISISGLLLFTIVNVYAHRLDSLGMDNASTLNELEVVYFNELFKDTRGDFSFGKAKIIFVTGNSGKSIIGKKEYFNNLVKPWLIKGDKPQTFYRKLTKEEKIKSGGYDVIVLSWVKIFTKRRQKKILKKAKIIVDKM